MNSSWTDFFKEEADKDYHKELVKFVTEDAKTHKVYPHRSNLFKAYDLCPPPETKVIILGQDPYHGPNQAHGLSFSVPSEQAIPPSLRNILKEINADIGLEKKAAHGCLESWAKQGVMLLNSILTVRDGSPGSHKNKGWETFTDNTIRLLAGQDQPMVFMLWGAFARSKKTLITNPLHLVLEAAHPSPLSAYNGFFGCKHFSQANKYLVDNNVNPIDWSL